MYCKDCSFWEHHSDTDWGLSTSWSTCELPVRVSYPFAKINENDFVVYAGADDDSGLNAGLITGPMFGCIKFEQR